MDLPVGGGRVEHEVGEEADEEEVEDEGAVVDVAAEAVPLVPDEGHAERVAEQLRPLLAHHDHDRVVGLQDALRLGVRLRLRVQLALLVPDVRLGPLLDPGDAVVASVNSVIFNLYSAKW